MSASLYIPLAKFHLIWAYAITITTINNQHVYVPTSCDYSKSTLNIAFIAGLIHRINFWLVSIDCSPSGHNIYQENKPACELSWFLRNLFGNFINNSGNLWSNIFEKVIFTKNTNWGEISYFRVLRVLTNVDNNTFMRYFMVDSVCHLSKISQESTRNSWRLEA